MTSCIKREESGFVAKCVKGLGVFYVKEMTFNIQNDVGRHCHRHKFVINCHFKV